MATLTYRRSGVMIDYTPSGDVAAGDVIVQGALVAVAKNDIPANTLGALAVQGEFSGPKSTSGGTGFAAGTVLYWDASNKQLSKTASVGERFGLAAAVAADGDAACVALLDSASQMGVAAVLTALTDSTGGTASGTLAAITASGSYAQADMTACKNNIASLAAKLNAVIAGQKTAGQMASS